MINSDNRFHIAVFVRYVTVSGAHRAMLQLADGLVKKGYQVDLVFNFLLEQHRDLIPAGVRVFNLNSSGFFGSLQDFIRYVRSEQPAIVISTLYSADTINLLTKLLTRNSYRAIVSLQNTVTQELKIDHRPINRLLTLFCTRFLYYYANKIAAVSKGVAHDLANFSGLPSERISVIYNPILTPDVFQKGKEPIEHPWFSEGQPPVILGVGRLEKQKDFPNLIRAFAKVRKVREARLVILGWGNEMSELENLTRVLDVHEDVAFLGAVRNPYAYMARSAVFALSSLYEGLPTVLIEAMAMGVPVVSTDCPHGPAEILNGGEYGELLPCEQSDLLAEAIVRVLDGEKKFVPASWLNQFTAETNLGQFLSLLND